MSNVESRKKVHSNLRGSSKENKNKLLSDPVFVEKYFPVLLELTLFGRARYRIFILFKFCSSCNI